MKQKLSITVEEDLIEQLENLLNEGRFRNKSHIVEYSINQFLKERKNV